MDGMVGVLQQEVVGLIHTPGLGSVFAHNIHATSNWLPNVAVAIVVVSAERPLSSEDRQLLTNAKRTASRVVVILSKLDLVSETERDAVAEFVRHTTANIWALRFPCCLCPAESKPKTGCVRSVKQSSSPSSLVK